MKCIEIKPFEKPATIEIENTLKSFQRGVGGYIEVHRISNSAAIVCNEEGKVIGLPMHKYFVDDKMNILDGLCGTFYIVGVNEEGDFISLTDEQSDTYTTMFSKPYIMI